MGGDMDSFGSIIVAALALVSGLGSAAFVFVKGRGENQNAAANIAVAERRDAFAQNIELNKYIDEKVAAATRPLVERIAALEAREDSTKTIVRRFFQRLVFWDTNGRSGPMPMPSPDDMRDLDLEDLQPRETP
jgi:hypothetical protein